MTGLPVSWTIDDVDGDGHVDFALAGPHRGLEIRLGDGTGSFAAPVSSPLSGVLPLGDMQVADLDADGHDDLVVPGAGSLSEPRATVAVFWGNGSAALGAPTGTSTSSA